MTSCLLFLRDVTNLPHPNFSDWALFPTVRISSPEQLRFVSKTGVDAIQIQPACLYPETGDFMSGFIASRGAVHFDLWTMYPNLRPQHIRAPGSIQNHLEQGSAPSHGV